MKPKSFASIVLFSMAVSSGCRSSNPPPKPRDAASASSVVLEEPARQADSAPETAWDPSHSTSLRNPNDGSLVGGVPLPLQAPGLRFNPSRDPAARYGTVEVVRALVDAAEIVDSELGGLPVTINDLSYESGGPIPRHSSHQSGRDVDVFFYQIGPDGNPIASVGAFFDPEGRGVDFRDLADPSDDIDLEIDLRRTWRFVQALIEDDSANLQSIYLAEHLRTLLLDHARVRGAPKETIRRFAAMTCQPGYPHDDHFHFRFYCSAEDIEAGCRDSEPIHPWRKKALAQAGVEPLPMLPKRPRAVAATISHEEARRQAGEMDAEVVRWLDRREAWLAKPHTGRKYCP
jgi:penicillin-insensitive murein endopeptidase